MKENDLKKNGYRKFTDISKNTDGVYIKKINGITICIYKYDFTKYSSDGLLKNPIQFSAWCQYNTSSDKPCFNVELLDVTEMECDVVESFFRSIMIGMDTDIGDD